MIPKVNFIQMIESLKRLGFHSYNEYLSSNIWRMIRLRANNTKTGKKNECFICLGKGDLWHHRTYKRMGNERALLDIVRLCKGCHTAVHSQPEYIFKATKKLRNLAKRKL